MHNIKLKYAYSRNKTAQIGVNMQTVDSLIQNIRETHKSAGWTDCQLDNMEKHIRPVLANWSEVVGLSEVEILAAMEAKRDYSAVNYYANCQSINAGDVTVYQTLDEFRSAIGSDGYRCPCCDGISSDPYECNTGINDCKWKSYGLFSTMGKGHRFIVVEDFIEHPGIVDIFMPVALEKDAV